MEKEVKRLQDRIEEFGKKERRGRDTSTERAIHETGEEGELREEGEEDPHDETEERRAHEKVRELEEETANLRRIGKEREDQKSRDEETMQRLRAERDAAQQERDKNARDLRAEKNVGKEWEGQVKILKRNVAEAEKERVEANKDKARASTEKRKGVDQANKVAAQQKKNTDTANNTIKEMVLERKENEKRMERDKTMIEDLERRLAESERRAQTANNDLKEMETRREREQTAKEELEGIVQTLSGKLENFEYNFMLDWTEAQRTTFRVGRELAKERKAADEKKEQEAVLKAKVAAGRAAFIARGAVGDHKESNEPPEGTSREVVEVDYEASTDEGPAEEEFFFPPPSTPGTGGEEEATEAAGNWEPGLQPSSSSSTVWNGNQWKEPDQEGTQEATREETREVLEGEGEPVGRGHRTRQASRAQEPSPMAKAQPKKARKPTAGKGKGRSSGAK